MSRCCFSTELLYSLVGTTTDNPCTHHRVDRTKYQIQIPLPPKIDASVTMMTVEEKPDVTYSDIGGCKEQIDKMREVVELPMLHPEKFVALGIDPPKGVLCYGPPGTGQQTPVLSCATQSTGVQHTQSGVASTFTHATDVSQSFVGCFRSCALSWLCLPAAL